MLAQRRVLGSVLEYTRTLASSVLHVGFAPVSISVDGQLKKVWRQCSDL